MTDMISDNDKTETFSIEGDETQTFNPEIDKTENRAKQTDLSKLHATAVQSSNGLDSGKESKAVNAEEIRKKLKYMEHILDIEN